MTVPRYIAGATVVYLIAFTAMLAIAGGFRNDLRSELVALWPLVPGAFVMGALGTLAPIARFGDAGGSIYFPPTCVHLIALFGLAAAVLSTRW